MRVKIHCVTKEQLLAEVDDILRTMPPREEFEKRSEESASWVGRAAAAVTRWDMPRFVQVNAAVDEINKPLDTVRNVSGREEGPFEMAEKFKTGDVVRLKSGGPNMTVTDYNVYGHRSTEKLYLCRWFDEKHKPAELTFKEEELELVRP